MSLFTGNAAIAAPLMVSPLALLRRCCDWASMVVHGGLLKRHAIDAELHRSAVGRVFFRENYHGCRVFAISERRSIYMYDGAWLRQNSRSASALVGEQDHEDLGILFASPMRRDCSPAHEFIGAGKLSRGVQVDPSAL
jgi:hypothetical protein